MAKAQADKRARLIETAMKLAYKHGFRETSLADIAEAEASTGRGLAIADRLDDPRLRSAALDALTCCAQARGAWAQSRQFAQERLAFEDRLDLHERLDAYTMVAWASALLGDLAEADRATASALGLFQSGQVHWWGSTPLPGGRMP